MSSSPSVTRASCSVFLLLVSGFWILASLTAPAIVDTNNNTLSDIWGKQYNNGNLIANLDPQADPDSDGWTNIQEAAAGTNPFDPNPPNGFIRPDIVHIPATYSSGTSGDPEILTPEAITLTWPTLRGKQYTLHYSPDLSEGSWQPVEAPYIGNGNDTQYGIPLTQENGSTPDKLFWRVTIADIDTDNDTLTDAEEHQLGTNPNSRDSDADGVSDPDEILVNFTNPLTATATDTDNDGIPDDFEKHLAKQLLRGRPDPASWGPYYSGLLAGNLDATHDYTGDGMNAQQLATTLKDLPTVGHSPSGYVVEEQGRRSNINGYSYSTSSIGPNPGGNHWYNDPTNFYSDVHEVITQMGDLSVQYLLSRIDGLAWSEISKNPSEYIDLGDSTVISTFRSTPITGPAGLYHQGFIHQRRFRIIATSADHEEYSRDYLKVLFDSSHWSWWHTKVETVAIETIKIPKGKMISDWYEFKAPMVEGKIIEVDLLPVEIKAYRPEMVQQSVDLRPSDQTKLVIPDAEELNPGVRIRVNRDDDDYDSPYKSDADEDSVSGENDLIKVEFSCPGLAGMTGIKVFLKRSNSKLRTWEAKEKGTAILKNEDEKELTLDAQGAKTIWVEAIDQGEGELEWQLKSGTNVIGTAGKLKFITYKELIVGLSGETFYSGGANGNGMFSVCQNLYLEGYNIAYYDVNGINTTSGDPAYREAGFQIWQCFVRDIGMFGHSHGGGATHDISKKLNDTRSSLGSFGINFTGYMDAIQHDGGTFDPAAETRYPPSSLYHWNYYQRHLPIRSNAVTGAAVNLDVNTTTWGSSLGHTSIDSDPTVQKDLHSAIKTHVAP